MMMYDGRRYYLFVSHENTAQFNIHLPDCQIYLLTSISSRNTFWYFTFLLFANDVLGIHLCEWYPSGMAFAYGIMPDVRQKLRLHWMEIPLLILYSMKITEKKEQILTLASGSKSVVSCVSRKRSKKSGKGKKEKRKTEKAKYSHEIISGKEALLWTQNVCKRSR